MLQASPPASPAAASQQPTSLPTDAPSDSGAMDSEAVTELRVRGGVEAGAGTDAATQLRLACGMLARGTCRRVRELELTLPESEEEAVPGAAEQLFRSVPRNPSRDRPAITKLTISLRLLTPEAARAAEAALPGLEELVVPCDGVYGRVDGSLDLKTWEQPPDLQQLAKQQHAALGLAVLLGPSRAARAGSRAEEAGGSAVGAAQAPLLPALRRLDLGPNLNELPQALAAALRAATQLRSLRLHLDLSLDGAIPSLSRLSGMMQLDTLELASTNASRPAGLRFTPQQVASLGAALAPLSGTLRALAISFDRCDVINAKCFTALRGLQELTLGGAVVLASSLPGLTSLTRLHAGGVGRTASQVEAGARFGLPPQLRALRLSRAQAVEDLAALEPSPSLTEVAVGPQAPGVSGVGAVRLRLAYPTSFYPDGRLSPAGEEALCRASALVSAPHTLMLDVGWRNGSGPVPLLLPPSHPAPGSEGHGRWLSAWGANGLRGLGLGGFALSAADLATIARCMPGLESLDLSGCSLVTGGPAAPPASASQPTSQPRAPVLDLQCFTELRGLRELTLGNVTVRASSLPGLTSLTRLHAGTLALTKGEHQSGARFGLPPQLQALRLSGSRPQSVEALVALEPSPSLTEVAVGPQAPGDGGIGVVHMALAYPTSFRNSDDRLSPAGEEALCRAAAVLRGAHTLVLDGPCSAVGSPAASRGPRPLAEPVGRQRAAGAGATIARCMPGLESLDLSGCSLVASPEPLAFASQPPSQASGPGLNLQCFADLQSLRELRLGGATVRASSLAALRALTRLHAGCVALRVREQQAGARFGLPPQLRALRLSSPQDVEDLAALEPLPSLTEVAVGPQAPGGGGIGVVRLSLALPTSVDAGGRLSRAGEEALCRAAALLSGAHELQFEGAARQDNLSLLLGFEGHGRWLSAWGANGLRGLVLGGVALTATDLATIARCMPDLESLDLSGCSLPDGPAPPASASQPPSQASGPGLNLQCFADLQSLQELRLGNVTVRASSLPGLASLTRLHAGGVGRTAEEVEAGARFRLPPQLRALRLSGPQSVEALAALEPLPSLTEVAVGAGSTPSDSDSGRVRLSLALPTSFDAEGRLSRAGQEALCRAAALLSGAHTLVLDGPWRKGDGPVPLLLPPSEPAPSFGGHGGWLRAFGANELGALMLVGVALTASDLATIARCMPRLEVLALQHCAFPVEALAALAALRNLASLVITRVPGAEVPQGTEAALEDLRARTGPRLAVTFLPI